MASRQQIYLRVHRQYPEPITISFVVLLGDSLAHIPHPQRAIFRVRDDDLRLLAMKHDTGHVIYMPAQGIHLPRFIICNPKEK